MQCVWLAFDDVAERGVVDTDALVARPRQGAHTTFEVNAAVERALRLRTPLVGINIFLASYRFKRPVLAVCRAALPFMAILLVGVLLITYIPWLTTGLLRLR